MSRRLALAAAIASIIPAAAAAQSRDAQPERIDILAPVPENEVEVRECTDEQEAAIISGEIVVCRRFQKESTDGVWNKEAWENGYAARTQGEKPVDVAGAGIFRGPPTVSGLCFIPPCPGPAPLMIDVEALPEAPPGSDADRVGRGLAPRGLDTAAPSYGEDPVGADEELGLPPVPEFFKTEEAGAANPEGSEAPGELP